MNLALFAHPDDETLGCGGLITRAPAQWHVAILADGVSSREYSARVMSPQYRRTEHFAAAMQVLGLSTDQFELHGLPDQRLDTLDFLDLCKGVAQIIERVNPTEVFTHFRGDLNRDHRLVCEAVHVACRPPEGPTIWECEVASSTEWGIGEPFQPNVFISLAREQAQMKVGALECYADEVRPYPHPRSPRAVLARLQYWGQVAGVEYAEPFTLIREVR